MFNQKCTTCMAEAFILPLEHSPKPSVCTCFLMVIAASLTKDGKMVPTAAMSGA